MSLAAVAGFIDRLIDSGGFSELVFRVKEHIRRGDNSIGPDEEETVYNILGFCLKYFRLKVEHSSHEENWVPQLQPIMQALDRMSFNRVVGVTKQFMETKKFIKVGAVVQAYGEMLGYLHLFLCSADRGHHEFAVALLFNLFFRSSDRLDPLPQLLRDWRPSLFDRNYVNSLIELVHSTLKLLEKVKAVYSVSSMPNKRVKKKESISERSEVALEQYIAAVVQFDVNEYFKRLISHPIVRMYTRVLEKYETNEAKINHYIYVFFHRMLNFQLDSNTDVVIEDRLLSQLPSESSLTLGHMLFNAHTLFTFSNILDNVSFAKTRSYFQPLIDLIKSVVRRFFLLASKNHLLFVEALVIHPFAVDFIQRLDNVYDAASYGTTSVVSHPQRHLPSDQEDSEEEVGEEEVLLDTRKRQRMDLGDEFDEADLPAALNRKDSSRKRSSTTTAADRPKRVRRPKHAWSEGEDDLLRDLYKLYRGSRSIFETIALNPDLLAMKRRINARAVERRVRELELHVQASKDTESDENNSTGDEGKTATEALSTGEHQPDDHASTKEPSLDTADNHRKSIAAVWENQSDDDDKWSGRRAFTQRSKLSKRKTRDSDSEDDAFASDERAGDAVVGTTSGLRLDDDDDE